MLLMSDRAENRIYLDNAATSWPKPEVVYAAVDDYQRRSGTAVGRGATRRGADLQRTVDQCRLRAARLLGAESPERICFSFNGTDALNLALHGVLNDGDHVVTTVMEHNSVLRPLRELQSRRNVSVTYVGASPEGLIDIDELRRAVTPATRLIALIHASNVTGTIQPIEQAAEIAHQQGALLLVDAAQTAGHVPIDLQELRADLLACSGHKGLLGPLGTGLIYVRPGVETELRSYRQGGTGSRSDEDRQPDSLPDKYESGNHNAPGLVGLHAALGWLQERGVVELRRRASELTERLREGLARTSGVTVFGPSDPALRTGVVSMTVDGFDPRELAVILDENFGVEVRAGFHCAPRAHQALGTADLGGTVRFSPGPFTTEDDIDRAIAAIRAIAVI